MPRASAPHTRQPAWRRGCSPRAARGVRVALVALAVLALSAHLVTLAMPPTPLFVIGHGGLSTHPAGGLTCIWWDLAPPLAALRMQAAGLVHDVVFPVTGPPTLQAVATGNSLRPALVPEFTPSLASVTMNGVTTRFGLLHLPLWWLAPGLAILAWWVPRRWLHSQQANHCPHCQYPRTGIAHAACCPECGQPPTVP